MTARLLSVLLAALLAGCATGAGENKVSDKDAARYNTQLGITYLQRNDLESAREKLERAAEQDPTLAEAHAALGLLYERVGEAERAGSHLQRAARLAPDDPNMLNNYGGFLCRRGERSEGIRYFERAAKNAYYRTPATALTNAGVCARGIPDLEKAEQYLRLALQQNPTHAEALLQMADLSVEKGEPMQARAFLQRYEAVGPVTPASLWLGRQTEQLAGDQGAARDYGRRLKESFPESAEARRLGRDSG